MITLYGDRKRIQARTRPYSIRNPGSVLDLAVDLWDQLVIKGRFDFLLSSELTKTSLTYLIKHYDDSHSFLITCIWGNPGIPLI